jgi:hypothetical protein
MVHIRKNNNKPKSLKKTKQPKSQKKMRKQKSQKKRGAGKSSLRRRSLKNSARNFLDKARKARLDKTRKQQKYARNRRINLQRNKSTDELELDAFLKEDPDYVKMDEEEIFDKEMGDIGILESRIDDLTDIQKVAKKQFEDVLKEVKKSKKEFNKTEKEIKDQERIIQQYLYRDSVWKTGRTTRQSNNELRQKERFEKVGIAQQKLLSLRRDLPIKQERLQFYEDKLLESQKVIDEIKDELEKTEEKLRQEFEGSLFFSR